jgi:hypothetical protein
VTGIPWARRAPVRMNKDMQRVIVFVAVSIGIPMPGFRDFSSVFGK